LKASGDVDPITLHITLLLHDVAQVDTELLTEPINIRTEGIGGEVLLPQARREKMDCLEGLTTSPILGAVHAGCQIVGQDQGTSQAFLLPKGRQRE
jgi:hypothetical protein